MPTDDATSLKRPRFDWTLAAIVLLGLALRLYRLDWQSAWFDELYTLYVSTLDWRGLQDALVADVVHPPLHYALAHLITTAAGLGAVQVRMLSAISGTTQIVVLYLLVRRLLGRPAALLSALLLAWSQCAINESQEARGYALATLFAWLAAYWFLIAIEERRLLAWCGFTAVSCLMLYTHYYTIFVLGALVTYGLVYRARCSVPRAWWALGLLAIALSYVPWLNSGVVHSAIRTDRFTADPGPTGADSSSLPRSLNWFNNGKWNGLQDRSPLWTFPAGGLLFTLPAAIALLSMLRRPALKSRQALVFLATLWLLPWFMIWLGSWAFRLQLQNRYMVFVLGPYYAFTAAGILSFRQAWRRAFVAAIGLYSIASLHANYFIPAKADYRHAMSRVASFGPSGVCFTWAGGRRTFDVGATAWAVYEKQYPPLPTIKRAEVLSNAAACQTLVRVRDDVWWTPYPDPDPDPTGVGWRILQGTYPVEFEERFTRLGLRVYRQR